MGEGVCPVCGGRGAWRFVGAALWICTRCAPPPSSDVRSSEDAFADRILAATDHIGRGTREPNLEAA
jgi:hypothetical protein